MPGLMVVERSTRMSATTAPAWRMVASSSLLFTSTAFSMNMLDRRSDQRGQLGLDGLGRAVGVDLLQQLLALVVGDERLRLVLEDHHALLGGRLGIVGALDDLAAALVALAFGRRRLGQHVVDRRAALADAARGQALDRLGDRQRERHHEADGGAGGLQDLVEALRLLDGAR